MLSVKLGAALVVVALVGVAGCSASGTTGTSVVRTAAPIESDICQRHSTAERADGPLVWEAPNTITLAHTWRGTRVPQDHGLIALQATAPVVLDSVTIAPEDPAIFAPVGLLGAWVSPPDTMQEVDAGHWPDKLSPLACHVIRPQRSPLEWPVLVVRLKPPIYAAAHGRKWSADRAVVLHYHTLDGTPYEAPFADVNVYPTSPKQNAADGDDVLEQGSPNPS